MAGRPHGYLALRSAPVVSARKNAVEAYFDCFNHQDWTRMLSLVTDDIERWEVGEPHRSKGKAEFERDIRAGPDVVELHGDVARMTEEGSVVVAEGTVRVSLKDGKIIRVQICNVFEFEGEKIRRITSFGVIV